MELCFTDYVAQNVTTNLTLSAGQDPPSPLPSVHGWIIWQQRFGDKLNFNRKWTEYKSGFGSVAHDEGFWLGLDAVHHLTTSSPGSPGSWKLRVEVQSAFGDNLW